MQLPTSNGFVNLQMYEKNEKIYQDQEIKLLVISNKDDNSKYFAKMSLDKIDEFPRYKIINFSREVNTYIKLNHPSILKFVGYSPVNFKEDQKPCIISEFASNGTLSEFLKNRSDSNIIDTKKLIIIYGIASGMSYLHSHGIIHCNLHPDNIYLNDKFYPKITDFSLSKEISQEKQLIDSEFKIPIEYAAPELLSTLKYSKSTDVYSFSIILYEIISNKKPFYDMTNKEDIMDLVRLNKIRPKLDDDIPESYRNLIEKCWSQNASERPTFELIVKQLKSEEGFITNEINKKEYETYIENNENAPRSFDMTKRIQQLDEMIHSKSHKNMEEKIDIRLRGPDEVNTFFNWNKYKIDSSYIDDYFYNYYFVHDKGNHDDDDDIKFLVKTPNTKIENFTRSEMTNFVRELNITIKLNHPTILRTIGYNNVDPNNEPRPFLLIEHPSNKTLDEVIRWDQHMKDFVNWDDTKKLIAIYGIAAGMAYLHSHNIIHRDLNIYNIRLDYNQMPKITGFNISKEVDGEKTTKSNKLKGTPAYLAPEIYLKHEYSKSSDVYSFGLLVYEMLTDLKPFNKYKNAIDIKHFIADENKRPKFRKPIPESYRLLIEKCWSQNPDERPTFDEILQNLKTDSGFILDKVEKDYFLEYIKSIDEFKVTFDSFKQIKEYDDLIKTKIETFIDLDINANFKNIYETFYNNISLSFKNLNRKDYENQDDISRGNTYRVLLVRDKKTDKKYALKSLRFPLRYKDSFINFFRELNIIFQIDHPSILKFIGYIKERNHTILVEYALNGSLDQVNKSKNHKNWNSTKKLINIYGIAAGMAYLHAHNIIHRDLKTQNILLDENLYPRISGFNISKEIKDEKPTKSFRIKGTPAYLAPEVFLNHEYSKSSDVYSFSMIMYEILTGKKPFDMYLNAIEIKHLVAEQNERPKLDDDIPESYRNLIEKCWSQNASERPTFELIVKQLKSEEGFITNEINKKEYETYIENNENAPRSFDMTKRIQQLDDFIRIKTQNLEERNYYANLEGIYKTETYGICLDIKMVNITNYEKKKVIAHGENDKIYEYLNKNDNFLYIGRKFIRFQNFSNMVNIISKLDHPSINKFIGYSPIDIKNRSNPTIITEFASNGTLDKFIEAEKFNKLISEWNETKKLIIIYGIASGMSYLHSKNIIHCNLVPNNIFLDDFLFPKIENFVFSKDLSLNKILFYPDYCSLNLSTVCCPPENIGSSYTPYTKSSDVYMFALVLYEILTNDAPYDNFNSEKEQDKDLYELIKEGIRPSFKKKIPDCYKKLIEECWSNDPNKRPTFDQILNELKTNPDFITNSIKKEEFYEYINFIEKAKKYTFSKVIIKLPKINKSQQFLVNMDQVDLKDFERQSRIGQGGFGSVYKVIERKTDEIYAAKVSIYELNQCTDDIIKNLSREVEITSKLNHPAVIKFIGYNSNNFKLNPKPTIITEFAINGSLDKVIELERINCNLMDWDDTKKLICIYGIASGMSYLVKNNIIHRDLKPANIFLDEFLYPKIGDFGLSKKEDQFFYYFEDGKAKEFTKNQEKSGFKGTYAYCAPEIIKNSRYSESSDVYAYGMIVYEIMTAELPFKDLNRYQVIIEISKGFKPTYKYQIPYCYKKLIEKCLQTDPSKRPSFSMIVDNIEKNTEFITSNIDKDEFLNYVSFLKESDESKSKNKESESKSFSEKLIQKPLFQDANSCRVIEIEKNDSTINDGFLDLNRFIPLKVISKSELSKIYKVQEKDSGDFYAAKISMVKIDKFSRDEVIKLQREVNIISQLNHPSFLKFIGYSPTDFKKESKPVIVTELSSNGSLKRILEIERKGLSISGWNDTKKLINIYGIASGMSYLHSHNIIHRDLKPENIFVDEYLFPKIGDFGLSTKFNSPDSITFQSTSGIIGTPIYCSPEILESNEYSKESDVYSFAIVVFEIITNEIPFENFDVNNIFTEIVVNGNRPEINEEIPEILRELIENCWDQNPKNRPSFDQIVFELETNDLFITEKVNQKDFKEYIKFINDSIVSFDSDKKVLKLDEFIKSKSRICEVENEDFVDENQQEPNFNNEINNSTNSINNDEFMNTINEQ